MPFYVPLLVRVKSQDERPPSASSLCCGGYVVVELLPQEPSWELRAAGRRACVHWPAAGTRPAACEGLFWQCCVNHPAQSEDDLRTSDRASPAWCSASSVCEGPGGRNRNRKDAWCLVSASFPNQLLVDYFAYCRIIYFIFIFFCFALHKKAALYVI